MEKLQQWQILLDWSGTWHECPSSLGVKVLFKMFKKTYNICTFTHALNRFNFKCQFYFTYIEFHSGNKVSLCFLLLPAPWVCACFCKGDGGVDGGFQCHIKDLLSTLVSPVLPEGKALLLGIVAHVSLLCVPWNEGKLISSSLSCEILRLASL